MTDIMVDLETWGTQAGCAIRSIGACVFNRKNGKTGDWFYVNISTPSCIAAGLAVEDGTAKWWADQSKVAQESLLKSQQPLGVALQMFDNWLNKHPLNRVSNTLWAQGANFDFPVLEAAFKAMGHPLPWDFWSVRDTRTAYDLMGFDTRAVKRNGTHHNALDDCIHQAKCVGEAYKKGILLGGEIVGTPQLVEDDLMDLLGV